MPQVRQGAETARRQDHEAEPEHVVGVKGIARVEEADEEVREQRSPDRWLRHAAEDALREEAEQQK